MAYLKSEIELAKIDYYLKNYTLSIQRIETLLNKFEDKIILDAKKKSYLMLSNACFKKSETAKSLAYLKQYNLARNSMNSNQKSKYQSVNKLKIKEQDLKLKSTEQKLLKLQIASDNKKINSLALELNLKSNFSDALMQKLSSLDKITFAELKNIEFLVQNELDLKSNRAKLQKEIETLGNNFFNALTKKHTSLNDADLKLCSFVVLNLSNKEIAVSKNRATNSVKISKNRLKKNLLIESNDDLKQYLKDFL